MSELLQLSPRTPSPLRASSTDGHRKHNGMNSRRYHGTSSADTKQTCVDSFSKWAEAFPLSNKEAKTVARILVDHVFYRLGTPVALLTDNAGELDGHLMQEICQLLGIDKQRTSFYRPETNSVAE